MNMETGEIPGLLRPLRILSIEDDPQTVKGTVQALRNDGHIVRVATDAEHAQDSLKSFLYDLLLVDERLPGDAGSTLVARLKSGYFGPENVHVAFVFITANPDWPPRRRLAKLEGYCDIKRKGSGLTPRVREVVQEVRCMAPASQPGRLRRVIGRVQGYREDGKAVELIVPSWRTSVPVVVARNRLPGARYLSDLELLGHHFFAWMNLDASGSAEIEITNFEREESAGDDEH